MNIDSNLITATIAVIALISQPIATVFNNKHQEKMEKIKLYEISKRNTISDFITSTEEYYCNPDYEETFIKFNSCINNLYVYFVIPDSRIFDELKKSIKEQNSNKTQYIISEITKYLSKQLTK